MTKEIARPVAVVREVTAKADTAGTVLPVVALDVEIDQASEDSFPASDPPGWSGMRIGPPGGAARSAGLPPA